MDIDQHAARGQHARDLGEHLFVLGDVLDHLERHDRVERAVGERDRSVADADLELERWALVVRAAVLHRSLVDVDAR